MGQWSAQNLFAALFDFSQLSENRAELLGGWRPGRDTHQTMDFEP
jgi:hypothetical protein